MEDDVEKSRQGEEEAVVKLVEDDGLSKNARKRLIKKMRWDQGKEERKARKKEKRRQRVEQGRKGKESGAQNGGPDEESPTKLMPRPAQDGMTERSCQAQARPCGRILIDLGFDKLMNEREIRSMTVQLSRLYSDNRASSRPFKDIYCTDWNRGTRLRDRMDTVLHAQHERWHKSMKFEPLDWEEIVLRESEEADCTKVVYLTADAQETVSALEDDTIYVVGGLVDKNRYKRLCLDREAKSRLHQAPKVRLSSAALPISQYMDLATRKVLTVNQVVEIMLKWKESEDWGSAFQAVVPARKSRPKGRKRRRRGTDDDHDAQDQDPADTDDNQADGPQESVEALTDVNGTHPVEASPVESGGDPAGLLRIRGGAPEYIEYDPTTYFSTQEPPSELRTWASSISTFVAEHHEKQRRVVLITSGGTTVPLEKNVVRFLDNFSAGTRGATSAEYFLAHPSDYAVIFMHRQYSLQPYSRHYSHSTNLFLDLLEAGEGQVRIEDNHVDQMQTILKAYQEAKHENRLLMIPFVTVTDYLFLLRESAKIMSVLGRYALLYLAAAVSDFFLPEQRLAQHKIQSGSGHLVLEMDQTPKILKPMVKDWINQGFVVSFKLETDQDLLIPKAKAALDKYQHHLVIANLLQTRKQTVTLVSKDGESSVISLTHDETKNGVEIEMQLVDRIATLHHRWIKSA